MLLSALGTILGAGLAWAGIRELRAIAPANLPRLDAIQIDPTVLGYRTLGGFTTVNASVGVSLGKAWHLRAFGTNLTNVLGVTSAGSLYRGYDDPRYRIENVMRPRTIGIGVDYKFE